MKSFIFSILSLLAFGTIEAQNNSWFYLRAKDSTTLPFKKANGFLEYSGKDAKLIQLLKNYKITTFKKTLRKAKKPYLDKTYFVIADKGILLTDVLQNAKHLFASGEIIPETDKKIYEPNDYGLTSTIGENIGAPAILDYYDFMGLPEAWYYTTGSRDITVGISDGAIDPNLAEFKDKTRIFNKSGYAAGHGINIGANAAGQGDNGEAYTGVCYDCSVFGTDYGHFKDLSEVVELADAGAKVINCSWIGSSYQQSAQDVVNSLFDRGVLIVAAAGNKNFVESKGTLTYYPASYDHVISVSVAQYKYENPLDNIKQDTTNGIYYTSNLRGSLGRTMGFPNNDTLRAPFIYPVSVTILNKDVDILAPSTGQFLYQKYVESNTVEHYKFETSSGTAPFVTGTIGLMYSLYPCLAVEEVEPILKITAYNIDHIEANKPYAGLYGAGLLQTGKAVKLVHDLRTATEIAVIENQDFSRWDFKLTAISKEVLIRNQKFRETSTLEIHAKNKIRISENTILKPNATGYIALKIDASLKNECELRLREDNK